MSQEEQQQIAQQANDDFLAGFSEVRPADGVVVPPAAKEEIKKVEPAPVVAEPEKKEPEQQPATEASGISIAGFSEDEIKRLLERAARFDDLESQVRKANGKIGELNGKLQEYETKRTQQPTQSAPTAAAVVDNPELQRWAEDYPELVQLAESRANAIAEAKLAEKLQGFQMPDATAIKQEIYRETQLELMDSLHEGWRDTVNSQEFGLWIAAQPQDMQTLYSTTERANDLSKVLKGYETWKTSSLDRGAKSKQRLEAALTPDSTSSRAQQAPSAEDEFVAGFRNIRSA